MTSRTIGDEFLVKKRGPSSTRPPRGAMVDGSPRAQHFEKFSPKYFRNSISQILSLLLSFCLAHQIL